MSYWTKKRVVIDVEDDIFGKCEVCVDFKGKKIARDIYRFETVVDDRQTFYGDYIDYDTTKKEFDRAPFDGCRNIFFDDEGEENFRKDLSKLYSILIRNEFVSLED